MSDFKKAFIRTMGHEGGASFNPDDRGNVVVNGVVTIPTYKGIAPKSWPKWGGWKYIDGVKAQMVNMPAYGTSAYREWVKHLNKSLAGINSLQALVEAFYLDNFWKRLGDIEDQRIAETIFDMDVNSGSMGSKLMQRAAGVDDDGNIGPKSIEAINALDPVQLLIAFNTRAKEFYDGIIERNPSQEQFRRSWYSRLETYDNKPFVTEA